MSADNLVGAAFLGSLVAAAWLITVLSRGRRNAGWLRAAAAVRGTYMAEPSDISAGFGAAPWNSWSRAYRVIAARTIRGGGDPPEFWLLDLRYTDASSQETDTEWGMAMAIVRIPGGDVLPELQVVPARGLRAVTNGRCVFAWRPTWGPFSIGRVLGPRRLPALLRDAREAATRVDEALPPREERSDRGPLSWGLVAFGWLVLFFAMFQPRHGSLLLPMLLTGGVLLAAGLDWRRVRSATWFGLFIAVALTTWGVLGLHSFFLFYGVPIGVIFILVAHSLATSRTTRRDAQGRLLWRSARDP